MASEKVKTLGLERDYKTYLYYVGKNGEAMRKPKAGGEAEVLSEPITREKGFLYFVDKQGDISRSPMQRKGAKA